MLIAWLQNVELRRAILDICPSLRAIPVDVLEELLPTLLSASPESKEVPHDNSGLVSAMPGEASESIVAAREGGSSLDRYCVDMTQQARDGGIDPVIGREQEIRTMTDILLRRRQNNPLLTGEAGVGKTAVVEGLAWAIVEKKLPPALQNVRLLNLDVGALLAGASMKGEFEARLKSVLEESVRSAIPVILFVDEVHTLIGAGGNAGTGDAANLLKPALARGKLRTIGATTWSEYKRHIEKDAALTRRFQVLQIHQPEEGSAINMVRGLVGTFEAHHSVFILDEAIRAAVTLSHRYIPSRQLPDKAISLLDTACARVALSLHTPPSELQLLYRDKEALQAEESIALRQQKYGRGDPKQQAQLSEKIETLSEKIDALERRWTRERDAVQALLDARAQLLSRAEEVSSAAASHQNLPAPQTLLELEAALHTVRGDVALVHPEVSEACVAEIVSEWTGIPVGRMVKDEIVAVLKLHEQLGLRVIGQVHALELIARRIQVARAGIADPGKPVGVFLLSGPSGVGKTETALALAEALYGGEQNLITINMSEFQEAHSVSTLKGAPPGYVGYGEGGVLTEAVRRRPYSVILLDEIEKAHRDVHEIFYQVFDKGWMEDGEGRSINFRNCVILLTSNIGSARLTQLCSDPALLPDYKHLATAMHDELLKTFPPAFLGRLSVIPYLPLQPDALNDIVTLQLARVITRAAQQHELEIELDAGVTEHIIAACHIEHSGARLFTSYIDQHILPLLSQLWLESIAAQQKISHVRLFIVDGQIHHASE